MEMPIHFFDLLRWYAGEVKQVHGLMGGQVRKEMDYEQAAFVNLEFESGAIGQLSETINGFGLQDTIWAIGTKASILAKSPHPSLASTRGILMFKPHQRDMMDDWRLDIVRRKTFDEKDLLRKIIVRHLQEFIDCIVKDKDLPVTGEDGRKAVEICLAAEKSAMDEKTVKLHLKQTPQFALERLQKKGANMKYRPS